MACGPSRGAAQPRRARRAAAHDHVRRRRPRDHRRLGHGRRASPRSARSRSAAARCSASSRRWSTPAGPITPFVSVLTGITDSMVRAAPGHRAPCSRRSSSSRAAACWSPTTPRSTSASSRPRARSSPSPWPGFAVVDTAVLARRVLTRDEVPNCKLATLAPFFRAATTPDHRALDDARATVDVLHGLIGRLGNLGVQSLPELRAFTAQVTEAQRRKRHLADGLPTGPGVYIFRDAQGTPALRRHQPQPAHAGPAVLRGQRDPQPDGRDGRAGRAGRPDRVRARPRGPGARAAADRRAQAALQPPLEVPRALGVAQAHRRAVPAAVDRARRAATTARPTSVRCAPSARPRPCATRSTTPSRCASAPTGCRCAGSCGPRACWPASAGARRAVRGRHEPAAVRRARRAGRRGLDRRRPPARRAARAQARRAVGRRSATSRPASSATASPRWSGPARACSGCPALHAVAELVAARPDGDGGWELSVVRSGRLAAAGRARRAACRRGRSSTRCSPPPTSSTDEPRSPLAEETECILRWLEEPGTRLVRRQRPVGDARLRRRRPAHLATPAGAARRAADPFADRRRLPVSAARPAPRPERASARRRAYDDARDHRDRHDRRRGRQDPRGRRGDRRARRASARSTPSPATST